MLIIPGYLYELTDGTVVKVIDYIFNVEYAGWACWPMGTRRYERRMVQKTEFVKMVD